MGESSGGVRIQSSREDFRRVHRAIKKAGYIFNIDCKKETTKSKNNKCNNIYVWLMFFRNPHSSDS